MKYISFAVLLSVMLLSGSALAEKDPFLWLEEVEGKKAMDWVKARNAETLSSLESDPRYKPFLSEATALLTATDRIPYGTYRGGYVYNFWQDKQHVRGVWRRTKLSSYQSSTPKWDVLLNFDSLAKQEKENWVYKGVECLAPSYTRCMLRLSRGGKDAAVYREFDLEQRAFVKNGFSLPEAKSRIAWIDKDHLLVGTDWGKGSLTESGYARVLKVWKRGTSLNNAKTVYEGQLADVSVMPWVSSRPEGQVRLVFRAVTFFTGEYYALSSGGKTTKLPLHESTRLYGVFNGQALFSTRKDWTAAGVTYPAGQLLATQYAALAQGKLGSIKVLFKPSLTSSLQRVTLTRSSVYLSLLDDVKGRLLKLSLSDKDGSWSTSDVALPPNGALSVVSSNPFLDTIFINYQDYVTPDQLLSLDHAGKLTKLRALPARFDATGVKVKQVFVTSKDGTRVPYFLVTPKGMKYNGKVPTLLYGYGGFEISLKPNYITTFGKLWLARGGAFAVANIRGGGEYGPRWHRAALKTNRQRAYDDFIAVAQSLVDSKMTSPKHLGVMGGSNGGLLVGAMLTQRPDLLNAVVCQVPLLDMLRYTKLLAGASWAGEYGDPSDPAMAKVISKYSPYQNLNPETRYPKVFFITSTKDDRVHPGHARKMAARMLSMGKPVYYYENIDGGHAAGANQNARAHRKALEFVYLWRQLGPDPN